MYDLKIICSIEEFYLRSELECDIIVGECSM